MAHPTKTTHQHNGLDTMVQSAIYDPVGLRDSAVRVKVTNDFFEDTIHGTVSGRRTGFCGGYTSSIANDFSSVMQGLAAGQYTPLPPDTVGTTSEVIRIASTSTSDSASGNGISAMIVFFLDLNYQEQFIVTALNGQTPVTLVFPTDVYAIHFLYAFPIAKGSTAISPGTIISNVGAIYLGTGTFSTSTGFTKNYMWNRILDGFISSAVYVVPKGYRGALWSVKFNTDATTTTSYKTMYRVNRGSPWQLLAEDTVNNTTVIQRSIAGGFFTAGAEFTVIGKRNGGSNIAANFVLTAHEISESCFTTALY
jgi:hypothetical protein